MEVKVKSLKEDVRFLLIPLRQTDIQTDRQTALSLSFLETAFLRRSVLFALTKQNAS